MRICIIGEHSGYLDEGLRNITHYLTKELSKHHQIMRLDTKKIFSLTFWRDIKNFEPQIIHYTSGPSIKSFIIVRILALGSNAKTIISAPHPTFSSFSKKLIPLFKPDLILVQSYETAKMFTNFGCEIEFLPNGVDTKKFAPVSKNAKEKLREKYGIEKNKFVILHVGHLTKVRNLQIFNKIQSESNQIVIVASSRDKFYLRFGRYIKVDKNLCRILKERGCKIWRSYFENVNEIYALSDCYIFPTIRGYSILLPLSVLEAMACNLPVITFKFGALPSVFNEGNGLIYVDDEDDFISLIEHIKNANMNVKTREKVLPYSWENVGKKVEEIYYRLLDEENEN